MVNFGADGTVPPGVFSDGMGKREQRPPEGTGLVIVVATVLAIVVLVGAFVAVLP